MYTSYFIKYLVANKKLIFSIDIKNLVETDFLKEFLKTTKKFHPFQNKTPLYSL